MLQALQRYTPVTVIDHVAAAFWRNPSIGIRLSTMMRNRTEPQNLTISNSSNYGLTPNWFEPHEFSYFWRDFLAWNSPHIEPTSIELESTDFKGLGAKLTEAARAAGKPLALKAFPLLWCGSQLLNVLPNALLVVMHRPAAELRSSLLRGWHDQPSEWFSLRPVGWKDLVRQPIESRVEFQLEALTRAANALTADDLPNIASVALDDLRQHPRQVAETIFNRLQ